MRIPIHISEQTPSGLAGAAFSAPGERRGPMTIPGGAVDVWGEAGNLGKILSEIGTRMQKARAADELAESKVRTREAFADLAHAMSDPEFQRRTDPADYESWFDEQAGDAWERLSKNIRDPDALHHARLDFEAVQVSQRAKVRGTARARQIDQGRASTHDQLTRMRDVLLKSDATGDTAGLADALAQAEALVAGKTAAGYYTEEESRQLLEEFRGSLTSAIWHQRIRNDPAAAAEALREPMASLDESDRLRLLEAAEAERESRLRQRNTEAERRVQQVEKALKQRQEAVAAELWTRINSGQAVMQSVLDRAVKSQLLSLPEYKALTSARRGSGGEPETIIAIERALDAKDIPQARALIYGAASDGSLNASTASTYLTRARAMENEEDSPLSGAEYTRAKQLISMIFKQDGLIPDRTLSGRARDAHLALDAKVLSGEPPLKVVTDIYRKEAGNVGGNLPADYAGPVTLEGLKAYQQQLTDRLQKGAIDQTAYTARMRLSQNALDELAHVAEAERLLEILRKWQK